MHVSSDDEMYRVDAVWLGPPNATFLWRARYVAWGVGLVVFLLVLTVFRQMGISLFWSIGWGLVVTIGVTRLIGKKITHERPLRDVALMAIRELTTPRQITTPTGGAAAVSAVGVREHRPRPRLKPARRSRRPAPSSARRQETTTRG